MGHGLRGRVEVRVCRVVSLMLKTLLDMKSIASKVDKRTHKCMTCQGVIDGHYIYLRESERGKSTSCEIIYQELSVGHLLFVAHTCCPLIM